MTKRNQFLLLPLSCLALAIAACGGDSGGSAATVNGGIVENPGATLPTTPVNVPDNTAAENPVVVITDPGVTDPVEQNSDTGNGDTIEVPDAGNNQFAFADSGLSHPGQLLPKGPDAGVADPFVSQTGFNQVQAVPDSLAMVFEIVENHGEDFPDNCKSLAAQYASCSVANIHIKAADGSLDSGDWRIYFPSIRRILRVDSSEFDVSLVNGDLNYIEPAAGFSGFGPTGAKSIKLITEFSHLHESDMMPRYFLVRDGQQPQLIANTDNPDDSVAYGVEITGTNRLAFNGEPQPLADSDNRFEKFSAVSPVDVSAAVIPTPVSTVVGTGTFDIGGGLNFPAGALPAGAAAALNARANLIVGGGANTVGLSLDSALPANTYRLLINAGGISITGADAASLFYGGQSLLSLITPGTGTVPQLTITDSPRFDYRGMHVDVARNFHTVDSMRKLIDQMAAYKMNVLHMHLTDDEGWRLEIPGLPELTSVGGRREFATDENGDPTEATGLLPQLGSGPFSNTEGNGFFTRNEFVQLLQYANDRFVRVVPEIDMPAHARAAVVAMRARAANLGQPGNTNIRLDDPDDESRYQTVQHYNDGIINPCLPGTYNFVETVVTEVKAMFDQAGMPMEVWHMGGDEANNIFLGNGFEDLSSGSSIPGKGDLDQSQFDFPFERSPACNALIASDSSLNNLNDLNRLFVVRVSEIVRDAGIPAMYAYQDILRNIDAADLATARAGVGFWEIVGDNGHKNAYEWPQRGYETVVAVPDFLYFDFPQEIDPKERGYYWATRFTDTQKVFSFAPENLPQNAENVLKVNGQPFDAVSTLPYTGFEGMQGQLWSETVRTAEQFDYMIFPRLLALAERAWHEGDWELDYVAGASFSGSGNAVDKAALNADWSRFANALGTKELPKLDSAGVLYRIPSAGARQVGGSLEINTQYPGLQVQYSNDGSTWQNYSAANQPASAEFVRALSASGTRTGRATPVN